MKKWRWACVALLVLGVVYLHHEVILGGQVYHGEDAADGYYPSHVAILRAFSHFELPLWERGAWSGWPLAVDPYYGLFYPLTVLFALFGAVRGLGVTIALHALAAGLGMLWLLRLRKLGWGAALVGAVSLAFGSFMVERIRHVIFEQMMAWLPLILAGVELYLSDDSDGKRRARGLVLAALATGMALICGALPLAPYVILVVGAYVVARLSSTWRLKHLVWLGIAAAIGGALSAAQVVPTVAHLPYSPRSLGVDYKFASTYAWPDWSYLGLMVAPNLFGDAERGHYYGAFNHWEMAGWYAGALTVLLAPLGLLRRRRELWALAVVALIGIGLAFGDNGHLHPFFFRYVPLYGALRCPTRALVMDLFALPILAGEGVAWLIERPRLGRRTALVAAGVLVVVGVTLWWWLTRPAPIPPLQVAQRAALAHLTWVVTVGEVLILSTAAAWLPGEPTALLLALLSLVDLVGIARGYVQPKPADWAPGTDRFAAVDWLLEQHPRDRFVTDWRGPFRLHNLGMTYDIEGAGGYESFGIWRYYNLLYTINHGRPYPFPKLQEDLAAGDIKDFNTPLVDLLNVRWFIGMAPPTREWRERFRPAGNAKPHAVHEPLWDPRLGVYENPHVLPRAFIVHQALVLPDDKDAAGALRTFDPHRVAIVDHTPSAAPVGDGHEPAEILVAERTRVVVKARSLTAGILVLGDAWYPGWRVTVDGQPAPLLRADYALRGVALPAGEHVVEFRFTSRAVTLGLLLSLLGCIALAALAWVGRARSSLL